MKDVYTVDEVAKKLKVTRITVRRWLSSGQLRGAKIGKIWRVREDDVEEFLRSRLTGSEDK